MSFVKDMLFGTPGEAATVQDVRTPNQTALGERAIGGLNEILGTGANSKFLQQSFEPRVAPITGAEESILARILGASVGDGAFDTARQQLTRQAAGMGVNPVLRQPGIGAEAGSVIRDVLTGRTMDPSTNPALAGAIQAAIRPLEERFADDMGALRGAFTRAGQFVQPGASSPFETARGRLQTGLADAMGDVSSRLVADNLNQERERQTQFLDMLNRSFEQGQNRATEAATRVAPFASTQLQALAQGLEAQALPRMVQQYGIEEGTRRFERQQDQLLRVLELAFTGAAAPQAVSVPGSEGSGGLLGGVLGAVGSAAGGPIGGAIGSKVANWLG